MFTVDNFIVGLQAATNIIVERQEGTLRFIRKVRDNYGSEEELKELGEIPIEEVNILCNDLQSGFTCNGSNLWSENSFEVAVQAHDRMRVPPYRLDRSLYGVSEHNYELSWSKASCKYLLAIICYFATNEEREPDFGLIRPNSSELISSLEGFFEWFRLLTVKIVGIKRHSVAEYKRMLNSYLFNISYNYDITLSVVDFAESRRTLRRRSRRSGQLFPYRSYNQELARYYHQAVATDIPFTQYLAF